MCVCICVCVHERMYTHAYVCMYCIYTYIYIYEFGHMRNSLQPRPTNHAPISIGLQKSTHSHIEFVEKKWEILRVDVVARVTIRQTLKFAKQ